MTTTTYNGWTNYATWRVHLEIFDSLPLEDFSDADDARACRSLPRARRVLRRVLIRAGPRTRLRPRLHVRR